MVGFISHLGGDLRALSSGLVSVVGLDLLQVGLEVGPGPLAALQHFHGVEDGAVVFLQGVHLLQHGQVDQQGEVLVEGNVGVDEVVVAEHGSGPHPVSAFKDVGIVVQGLQDVLRQHGVLGAGPHTGDFAHGVAGQHGQHQLGAGVLGILNMHDLDVVLLQHGGLGGQAELTVSLVGHGIGAGGFINEVRVLTVDPVGAPADDNGLFISGCHRNQGEHHCQRQQQGGKLFHGVSSFFIEAKDINKKHRETKAFPVQCHVTVASNCPHFNKFCGRCQEMLTKNRGCSQKIKTFSVLLS